MAYIIQINNLYQNSCIHLFSIYCTANYVLIHFVRTSIFEGRARLYFFYWRHILITQTQIIEKKHLDWQRKNACYRSSTLCYSEVAIHQNRRVPKIITLILVKTYDWYQVLDKYHGYVLFTDVFITYKLNHTIFSFMLQCLKIILKK